MIMQRCSFWTPTLVPSFGLAHIGVKTCCSALIITCWRCWDAGRRLQTAAAGARDAS